MLTTLALTAILAGSLSRADVPTPGPISHHLAATVFETQPLPAGAKPAETRSRDSLKNGAIIGAVIGGAATGLFIGYLCHLFNDSDLQCWKPVALWTGLGAGAGALAGAGVDALFTRRIVARATVRF